MLNRHRAGTFTGYPYLLTEESAERHQLRLLPAFASRHDLRRLLRRQYENLLLPVTLVIDADTVLRRDAEGERVLPAAPLLHPLPHHAPIPGEVEFTESVDIFHRFRHFRAWYAFASGDPLPTLDNPGFDRVRSFRGANEMTLFLALLGRDAELPGGIDWQRFVFHASWYDRPGQFWRQCGTPAWLALLAEKSHAWGFVAEGLAEGALPAKCQLDRASLLDSVTAEALKERLVPATTPQEAAG